MTTPHKYADAIKAWADGLPVQFRYALPDSTPTGAWKTYAHGFDPLCVPDFNGSNSRAVEWRVKPEPLKYRRYIRGDGRLSGLYVDVACQQFANLVTTENLEDFVRWIDTEWQEVEV